MTPTPPLDVSEALQANDWNALVALLGDEPSASVRVLAATAPKGGTVVIPSLDQSPATSTLLIQAIQWGASRVVDALRQRPTTQWTAEAHEGIDPVVEANLVYVHHHQSGYYRSDMSPRDRQKAQEVFEHTLEQRDRIANWATHAGTPLGRRRLPDGMPLLQWALTNRGAHGRVLPLILAGADASDCGVRAPFASTLWCWWKHSRSPRHLNALLKQGWTWDDLDPAPEHTFRSFDDPKGNRLPFVFLVAHALGQESFVAQNYREPLEYVLSLGVPVPLEARALVGAAPEMISLWSMINPQRPSHTYIRVTLENAYAQQVARAVAHALNEEAPTAAVPTARRARL